jgi:uncharacterized HAD superfamily protein
MNDRQIDKLIVLVKEEMVRLRERYTAVVKSKDSRIDAVESVLSEISENNQLIVDLENHKKEGKVWT